MCMMFAIKQKTSGLSICLLIFSILLSLVGVNAFAAPTPRVYVASVPAKTDTLKAQLYFRSGSTVLEDVYNKGFVEFDSFMNKLSAIIDDDKVVLTEIKIEGNASPEGRNDKNKDLALLRAFRVQDLLRSRLPEGVRYDIFSTGLWLRFSQAVEKSGLSKRAEILNIVKYVPEQVRDKKGRLVDVRINRLRKLNRGRQWREMQVEIFPNLRSVSVCAVYYRTNAVEETTVVASDSNVKSKNVTVESNKKMSRKERLDKKTAKKNRAVKECDKKEDHKVCDKKADHKECDKKDIKQVKESKDVKSIGESRAVAATEKSEMQKASEEKARKAAEKIRADKERKAKLEAERIRAKEEKKAKLAAEKARKEEEKAARLEEEKARKEAAKAAELKAKEEEVFEEVESEDEAFEESALTRRELKKFSKKNYDEEIGEGGFGMDLRTNLLAYPALVPNIGFDIYLGKNWSIGANGNFAWWSNNRNYYWRLVTGELNVRKYFGKQAELKNYSGHHIGALGGVATYDFQLGGLGYQNIPLAWFAGLEYGYSLPVAKRLNIDFSLGLGYFHSVQEEYDNFAGKNYKFQKTRLNYVIPVKAEIALVWLLGRNNKNRKY